MTPSAPLNRSTPRGRRWLLGIGLTILAAGVALPDRPARAAGVARPASAAPSGRTTCPPRWPYIVLTCVA